MNFYVRKTRWKLLLLLTAILIGAGSLVYTNYLVRRLSEEERKKIVIWTEAQEYITREDVIEHLGFYLKIIEGNETIPVIVADSADNVMFSRNLNPAKSENPAYVQAKLQRLKESQEPIVIDIHEEEKQYLYYDNSVIITQLIWYPYIQLAVIVLFIMVSYVAFNVSRKIEQNKVWVGLSKETAHQLGTPISSLMALLEILKGQEQHATIVDEFEKDVIRLQKITERFSKIGSKPALRQEDICKLVWRTAEYIRTRTSNKVTINVDLPKEEVLLPLNPELFEWVVENLCKNAIDAMDGHGTIRIGMNNSIRQVVIEVSDTGKGIPKKHQKAIFKPGFTTKERGWGLGLSLSKRIVEEYHNGRIFVSGSELGMGSTFRIVLRKESGN